MAFLVLAVGAFMVAAGSGLMAYGNGYIALEQGWSAFIAGSVLLTGGLVTMALGLALRALGELRTALVRFGDRPVAAEVPVADPILLRPSLDAESGAPHDARLEDSVAEPVRLPNEPMAMEYDASETRLPVPVRAPVEGTREPAAATFAPVTRDDGSPPGADRAMATAAPPVLDDWLDRSFADLDRDVAALRPGRTAEPEAPIVAPARAGRASALETEPSNKDTTATAARHDEMQGAAFSDAGPPMPAASPPASSPVIGRYESEGTSYVMYADGSIEAQSEAGIYRFASMAELKSFIEG